jgi:hypothetical protein
MAIGIGADPHVGPGRRYGQRLDAPQFVGAADRPAGRGILPAIDEALDHLAWHAKSEIALDARGDDARKSPLGGTGRHGDRNLDKLRPQARVGLGCRTPLADDRRLRTHCCAVAITGRNEPSEERRFAHSETALTNG